MLSSRQALSGKNEDGVGHKSVETEFLFIFPNDIIIRI